MPGKVYMMAFSIKFQSYFTVDTLRANSVTRVGMSQKSLCILPLDLDMVFSHCLSMVIPIVE